MGAMFFPPNPNPSYPWLIMGLSKALLHMRKKSSLFLGGGGEGRDFEQYKLWG